MPCCSWHDSALRLEAKYTFLNRWQTHLHGLMKMLFARPGGLQRRKTDITFHCSRRWGEQREGYLFPVFLQETGSLAGRQNYFLTSSLWAMWGLQNPWVQKELTSVFPFEFCRLGCTKQPYVLCLLSVVNWPSQKSLASECSFSHTVMVTLLFLVHYLSSQFNQDAAMMPVLLTSLPATVYLL